MSCVHYTLTAYFSRIRQEISNVFFIFKDKHSSDPKKKDPLLAIYVYNIQRGSHISLGWFTRRSSILTELEFGDAGFCTGKKTGDLEKNPCSKVRTNHKLNPHFAPQGAIEPETHWWEACAFTTAPSLPHLRN